MGREAHTGPRTFHGESGPIDVGDRICIQSGPIMVGLRVVRCGPGGFLVGQVLQVWTEAEEPPTLAAGDFLEFRHYRVFTITKRL